MTHLLTVCPLSQTPTAYGAAAVAPSHSVDTRNFNDVDSFLKVVKKLKSKGGRSKPADRGGPEESEPAVEAGVRAEENAGRAQDT